MPERVQSKRSRLLTYAALAIPFALSGGACVKPKPIVQTVQPSNATHTYTWPGCPIEQCDDASYGNEPGSGIYRGRYEWAFETSSFDDGSGCRYWLSGNLEPLWNEMKEPHFSVSAQVEVEGTFSPPGCYGHLGVFRRELKVTKVLSFKVIKVERAPPVLPEE